MNRQTILASIHRQLHESFVETGEVCPLGEIVARVAKEIRPDVKMPNADEAVAIIPMEDVAAFVDGNIDSSEADTICHAVMSDNSVLAELIAAVRSMQELPAEQLPALSDGLATQLHAMSSTCSSSPECSGSIAADLLDQKNHEHKEDVPEIIWKPVIEPHRPNGRWSHGGSVAVAVGLLSVAATIGIAFFLLGWGEQQDSNEFMIVVSPDEPPTSPQEVPDLIVEQPQDALQSPLDRVAKNKKTRPEETDDARMSVSDPEPVTQIDQEPSVEAVAQKDMQDVERKTVPPEYKELDVEPMRIVSEVPKLADFEWSEVSGLLMQRNELPAEPGSQQLAVSWSRIQQDAVSSMSGPVGQSKVAIRTLPFSRARGEFATGGRIVVAADTGLLLDRTVTDASAQFNLMHGSIAMMDFDEGTLVKLREGDESIATLRWNAKASAIVHRQATGLQIHVDGGPIEVNDRVVNEETVRVTDSRIVQTIRAPKRLPRWITRPDETTASERMVLAQIADTDDVISTLRQKVIALSASDRLSAEEQLTLGKLSNWYAAMSGENLYRLANSRLPVIRLAGLQRLAQMPESDPRFQQTWKAMERAMNNQQHFLQIRGWFRMIRAGTRPNRAQTEAILNGLLSRDFAGRAISDFVLRQYIRNPPPFDPSWTGTKLQRAVHLYRERAGLPMDRSRPAGNLG